MSEPLVDQLLVLCVAAEDDPDFKARSEDLGMPSFGALIDFAREHKHPLVQQILTAVNADADVVSAWEPDNGLCLATGTGTSERPDEVWLENFLFRALTNPEELWPTLAEDFLATARLSRDAVFTLVSIGMIGFRLPNDEPVAVGRGRLRHSVEYELSIPGREHSMSQRGVIYEYMRDIPARMTPREGFEDPFTPAEKSGQLLIDEDEFTRVLLALVLETDARVREYTRWRRPFYVPYVLGKIDESAGLIISSEEPPKLTGAAIAAIQTRVESLKDVDLTHRASRHAASYWLDPSGFEWRIT